MVIQSMTLPWKKPLARLIHGADYNPEQWNPKVWRKDVALMQKAGLNTACLGVFSWSNLEPEEGRYQFEWLDEIIDLLKRGGINFILATPSGARPPWLAQQYPEVLRVNEMGIRNLYGTRHNHCLTSPVYREKVASINGRLAERYGSDDAMVLWHVSNEYQGECHCDLCRNTFRGWLQKRYETLDELNAAWCCSFWSHRYSDWNQIDPPSLRGEPRLHGLNLAWKRFITDQTISFFKDEVAAIRRHDQATPVTTNMMGAYPGLDYVRFAREMDVASVNVYPEWHRESVGDVKVAADVAFVYDLYRSMKDAPFLMMESTPSLVNWREVSKLKRPGMNILSSLQAIAHGSDSVAYFQWRKSRGAFEKFHGAVVDHSGRDDTRVFQEVAELSKMLGKLSGVIGHRTPAPVAVIHDWENRWAFENCSGFRNDRKNYVEEVSLYHRALWQCSIPCDCVDSETDFSSYRLVMAPILYLVKPGVAERLEAFVRAGGALVLTYGSGWVNPEDLIFEDGQPGPLRTLLGLRVEESDSLFDGEKVRIEPLPEAAELVPSGEAKEICERILLETARPLAQYASEFYSGEPCLTVNKLGKGQVYYVAFRAELDFIGAFIGNLAREIDLASVWSTPLPKGVNAQKRIAGQTEFVFIMNFNDHDVAIPITDFHWIDVKTDQPISGTHTLSAYGILIIKN